jgi:hypothetical protein
VETTVPEPVPVFATASVYVTRLKTAVTDLAAVMLTRQAPVPVQAPLHPAKEDPPAGLSLRVTVVP